MKIFILAVILICCGIIVCGCSNRESVVVQEVYIPVKCNVEIPKKPLPSSYVNDVIEIIEYAEKLEKIVEVCVKGE